MVKKKNILMVTPTYPDYEVYPGGIYPRGLFLHKITKNLTTENYNFIILTPKIYKTSKYHEVIDGVEIFRFPFGSKEKLIVEAEGIPVLKMIRYIIMGFCYTVYLTLAKNINLYHSQWVVPTGFIAAVANMFFRKKHVITTHGTELTWGENSIIRVLAQWTFNCCDYISYNSVYTKSLMNKLDINVEIPQQHILVSGVDNDRFNKKEINDSDDIEILFIGSLYRRKNPELLLNVFIRLTGEYDNIRLTFGSEGPLKEKLEKITRQNSLDSKVTFLGYILEDDLPSVYRSADVFVLPSREEGLGVCLMEAASTGLAILASRTSGILTLIEHERNGLLFENENAEDLYDQLDRLINDRSLRIKLGEQAREDAVEKFSQKTALDKTREIYSEFLK